MRIRNRYSVESSKEIIELLEQLNIPYKNSTVFNPPIIQFLLYDDDPRKENVDERLTRWTMIIPELLFSKSDYENAIWYRFMPKFDKIPSCENDLTYSYFCKKDNGTVDYSSPHRHQIGYYRLNKKPFLPNNDKCIFSSEGNYDEMWFTNDVTRAAFECSNIRGIHFDPVLREQDDHPWSNIQQIMFDKTIPEEAIVMGKENGIKSIVTCESCNEKRYYVSPQTYQLCLYNEYIGENDLYVTQATFGQGYGYNMVIGSKKFYRFIKENNMVKLFNIHPIKTFN